MSQTKNSTLHNTHLKKDLLIFGIIFIVVLGAVITLYSYDLRSQAVSEFSSKLFHWLIDGDAWKL